MMEKPFVAFAVVVVLVLTALLMFFPMTTAADAPKGLDDELVMPSTMAALGDSVTAGYNANPLNPGWTDQYSWATGEDAAVYSHADRLGLDANASLNLAVPGTKMAFLKSEALWLYNSPVTIDYAVVLMGHNDACANSLEEMTPAAEFEADYRAALDVMKTYNPEMKVRVMGLVDPTKLYYVVRDRPTPYVLPNGYTLTCQDFWAIYSVCPDALTQGEESRAAVAERVKVYNKILRKGAEDYGYEYTDEVYKTEFVSDDVSVVDCFHPSIAGQNKISEGVWGTKLFHEEDEQ